MTTSPVTTSPVTTSPVTTSPVTTSPIVDKPAELADYGVGIVRLDGVELTVAVADDASLRARGLMHVSDLGTLDGMVFVWAEDSGNTFWMKDTPIPLDIAWFTASGEYVSSLTMEACSLGDACPEYAADARYRFALEMPAGTMPELDDGSVLQLVNGF